jgi:alpha-L-fucosidase
MNRRSFNSLVTSAASVGAFCGWRDLLADPVSRFQPTWDSLDQHTVPEWFQDAKFGIFIHWGLFSVPAWAPPSGELGKVDWDTWFTNNPYAEWYLNSLRIVGSPTYKHHVATYGKDFDYYQFTDSFNQQSKQWHPDEWASLFRKTGARYVVLVTKHHDGFRLWPSAVTNPHAAGRNLNAQRDIAGELTSAVRSAGMKMGLYYSGGLDWTFTSAPIVHRADLLARVPQSQEYADYADAHWRELTDRYQPSVMWNDISYPKAGKIPEIFAHYYNTVPEGVIDDRFGVKFCDYTTPEYAKYDKITPKKWESCRGLGFSFGYNQVEGPEQVIAPDKLIALLVDIVSKNGNLLLNVGPKPNGTISEIQADRLNKLGAWLAVNGEAIYETRPWTKASATGSDGTDVRFTSKGNSLYVVFLNRPAGNTLTVPGVRAAEDMQVAILGADGPASHTAKDDALIVESPGKLPESYVLAVKLAPAPQPIG